MELREIEILLKKFYDGKTVEQEESILMEYFREQEVPEHLQPDKAYFLYLENQGQKKLEEPDYDELLKNAIEDDSQPPENKKMRFRNPFTMIDVAAAILILAGIFFTLKYDIKQNNDGMPSHKTLTDTYEDPYKAYIETRKALLLVSENLNKGTEDLSYLNQFDKAADNLEQLSRFNTAMMKLNHISKFNENQNVITPKDHKK